MKKSKKYIPLISLVSLLVSCDYTLVDDPPLGPTELSYFTTVHEFRSQLTGVYAAIYDDYHFAATGYNGWVTGTWLLPGDDLTESLGARASVELFDGSLNPSNAHMRYVFSSCYKMIARANVTIDRVDHVDYSGYEGAEEISMMKGEALFLRAFAYFKLFNIYGSVPLVTKRLQTEEETNTPKSPAIDILSQVITDTQAALEIVPENWEESYLGRINKDAARGLLVKALVFRGNYSKNTADYEAAISIFNDITASLTANYLDNFSSFTENNQESLFEVQAAVPSSNNNNLNLHNDGAWRGVENMSVYRGYMMEFGGRGDFNDASSTKFLITEKLLNQAAGDPRLQVFLDSNDGFNGRIFQKYHKPEGINQLSGFHGGSVNNERVLRYADVKLLAAEAYLKTGNTSAAISQINEVRTRAREWANNAGIGDGTTPADYASSTDPSTIMQWIMDERYVELAGEGHRWWDLKRWHTDGDISLADWDGGISGFSTHLSSPIQFNVNKHLLFPIPQTEIERNSGIQENNPGY